MRDNFYSFYIFYSLISRYFNYWGIIFLVKNLLAVFMILNFCVFIYFSRGCLYEIFQIFLFLSKFYKSLKNIYLYEK